MTIHANPLAILTPSEKRILKPQCGQFTALSLTSFPHSLHIIKATSDPKVLFYINLNKLSSIISGYILFYLHHLQYFFIKS